MGNLKNRVEILERKVLQGSSESDVFQRLLECTQRQIWGSMPADELSETRRRIRAELEAASPYNAMIRWYALFWDVYADEEGASKDD